MNPFQIKISVKDTGLGIEEKDKKKLFHAFGRIRNAADLLLNSHGVGLGLLISNQLSNILNNYEGGIEVNSKLNEGSTFSFKFFDYLPEESLSTNSHRAVCLETVPCKFIEDLNIIKPEIPKSLSTQASIHLESKLFENGKFIKFEKSDSIFENSFENGILATMENRKNLKDFVKKCKCPEALVIDDNDFNNFVLQSLLAKVEILSESALSGREAMSKIIKMGKNTCCKTFQIIFLDLEMPFQNGVEVFEEIKSYYETLGLLIPNVIAVSSYSFESNNVQLAFSKGVKEYLMKPVSLEILTPKINKLKFDNNIN